MTTMGVVSSVSAVSGTVVSIALCFLLSAMACAFRSIRSMGRNAVRRRTKIMSPLPTPPAMTPKLARLDILRGFLGAGTGVCDGGTVTPSAELWTTNDCSVNGIEPLFP